MVSYAPIHCAQMLRRSDRTFYYYLFSSKFVLRAPHHPTSRARTSHADGGIFNTWMKENGSTDARMTRNFRSRSIRTDKEIIKFRPHSFVLIFPGPCYVGPVTTAAVLTDRVCCSAGVSDDRPSLLRFSRYFPFLSFRSFPLTFSDRFRRVHLPRHTNTNSSKPKLGSISIPTIHPSIHRT